MKKKSLESVAMTSSTAMSFIHLLVGLTGAAITGYGAQKVGQNSVVQEQLERCLKQKLQPKQTKTQLKKACEAKYDTDGAKMHKILMYGGCAFIVAVFLIIAILDMFGGGMMGMMGGGGGMGMGGQYY